jgi:1-phosphofructokinase
MIYTVTLNPAIDKSLRIHDFSINDVNRVTTIREDAGGKGINVSKMIKNFSSNLSSDSSAENNTDSIAVLLIGGDTGHILTKLLDNMNIDYHAIDNSGQTRINVKVVDPIKNTFTDINEPGPNVKEETITILDDYLKAKISKDDILVLAGSIPAGVPKDIYKHWCEMANLVDAHVILDADGDVFKEGLKGKPYIIKPNQLELEQYFGLTFNNNTELIEKSRELIE